MLSGLSKKLRGSLAFRLAFLFCATFAVGISSTFLVTYYEISKSLEKTSRESLTSKLHESSAILTSRGIRGLKEFLSNEKTRILNAPYMIRVLASNGDVMYMKPSVQDEAFDFDTAFKQEKDPQKILGWQILAAVDDEDKFSILTERVNSDFYLQVGKSSEDREDILSNILEAFAIFGVIFIILSGAIGMWYARRSLSPIRDLMSAMREIEKGDLGKRVAIGDSPGELRELGAIFNRMIGRIEKLIVVMKESLDNVAHDIRTPLTRIRAVAEDAIQTSSNNPVLLTEALGDCAESATGISELVDQLMSISEADAGTLVLKSEETNIKSLLEEVIEIYEFVAADKEINLELSIVQDDLMWVLDRKRIKQVVGNLIDNAIKFSPQNSSISIAAVADLAVLKITVIDGGIGIPDSELNRIWDRLFRGDKSRTTKGIGLGLSIVKAVVQAHGGEVSAQPNPDQGMSFSILLKK